jgi:branched-chain amino acid aminotransferase
MKYCYANRKIKSIDKIKISPYDLGLLRGYAVFDVMKTENGKPFLLDEHWKRFQNSAKELKLRIPVTKEKFTGIIKKLLKLNKRKEATIRTFLSGGMSRDAFTPEGNETFLILIEPVHELAEENYEKGVKLITVEYNRIFPKAKITNYVCALKNHFKKVKEKSFEVLYVKDGVVLEASTSNFFLVKDEKIITPKEGVLHGITRNLVLKLAKKMRFEIEEREVFSEDISLADEMFLTATNKKIVPVVRVDNKIIGSGKPGDITRKLTQVFEYFIERY